MDEHMELNMGGHSREAEQPGHAKTNGSQPRYLSSSSTALKSELEGSSLTSLFDLFWNLDGSRPKQSAK
nr:hypothetical protein Iba_chr11eCG6650 [Ipomoea batatas]